MADKTDTKTDATDKADAKAKPDTEATKAENAKTDETPKVKTIDSHEATVGWTVQSEGSVPDEPEAVPGAVITADELPSRESLEAAGVDVDQFFAGLVIVADDEERRAVRAG